VRPIVGIPFWETKITLRPQEGEMSVSCCALAPAKWRTLKSQNRRQLERIPLELPGRATPVLSGAQEPTVAETIKVESKNLSADGAYLVGDKSLDAGTRIQLNLEWPCGSELVAEADVLRVEVLAQNAHGFAVRFVALPEQIDA
jgi:hypothetical protein